MAEYTGNLNLTNAEVERFRNNGYESESTFMPGSGSTYDDAQRSLFSKITIKVSPEDMEEKAIQVLSHASKIRNEFDEISRIVRRSTGYWNGEAAESYRERYQEMEPDMQLILQYLEDHAKNLLEIAATYTETQVRLTAMAQALPKDAIE